MPVPCVTVFHPAAWSARCHLTSISGRWMLLCMGLSMAEDSPEITMQRVQTFECSLGVPADVTVLCHIPCQCGKTFNRHTRVFVTQASCLCGVASLERWTKSTTLPRHPSTCVRAVHLVATGNANATARSSITGPAAPSAALWRVS